MTDTRDPMAASQQWLEDIVPSAGLQNTDEQTAVQGLLGHEGFRLFLGLLLGSRQAFYVQLAALPLGNSVDAARASVIQGQIKGIDLARQTVLESFQSLTGDKGANA